MAVDISKLIIDIQAGRIEICYHEDDPTGHVRGFSTSVSEEEKCVIVNALVANDITKTLAQLMMQLLRHVPEDNSWAVKALAYLKKHNLQGSVLRGEDGPRKPIVMMFAGEEALED